MKIKDDRIDSGKAFDWGKTSREYAKYREHRELLDRIAPEQFEVSHYAALAVLRKR